MGHISYVKQKQKGAEAPFLISLLVFRLLRRNKVCVTLFTAVFLFAVITEERMIWIYHHTHPVKF
jgi:cell division protein FtsL